MQKRSLLPLWIISVLLLVASALHGQSGEKFTDRLWYGGGINLGISGGQGSSAFGLGLSPMVGYKIAGPLSVGPRVSVMYTHLRATVGPNRVESANVVTWGAGVFARVKVLPNIFGHVEYEIAEEAFRDILAFNTLEVIRVRNGNTYIGAGYNTGRGAWGSDITVLYNLTLADDDPRSPFSIRFGFTYNF